MLEELKERVTKGREISSWEEKRRAFFESRGMRLKELVKGGRERKVVCEN